MRRFLESLKNNFFIILNFISELIHWKCIWKAFLDLLLIAFFTMLASIMSLISMLVKSDNVDWVSLYNNGNFFLYSISLLSSSLIFYVNRNDRHFGKYSVMILITVCALIYSQFINDQKSNTDFTRIGSYVFLGLSFLSFLITQYFQRLELPDVNNEDRNNQQGLVEGVTF